MKCDLFIPSQYWQTFSLKVKAINNILAVTASVGSLMDGVEITHHYHCHMKAL